MQQASAQEESTTPAPQSPTLPFTPFSLQQQETVPEEQQPTDDEGDQSLTQVPPTGNATGATTMTASATNDTRGGAVAELPSSASEPPLIAEIITNATTQAVAPATIRFDANITGGAPPYSYSWSVPDFGVIDQDRSITQMFFEPGTFTYILTATDSRGKTVNDAVQIVISERLPQGGIVAPEPEGIAPPDEEEGGLIPEPEGIAPPEGEPIQEPGVPPPTVPGGEGGEDTGRGPQGGVTVGPGGAIRLIPYPTSGYVGDHFEIRSYLRDDVIVPNLSYIEHCYNYYPESGQCYPSNRIKGVDRLCTASWGELAPPGYHWLPSDCIVVTYLSPGTYFVAAGIADYQTGKVTFDNIARIDVRERPQGGATVAPEPGGVGLPERGGPPLPTAPEPEGIAPPDEEEGGGLIPEPGGVAPPDEEGEDTGGGAIAPEPGGITPPPEEPIQPEGQLS